MVALKQNYKSQRQTAKGCWTCTNAWYRIGNGKTNCEGDDAPVTVALINLVSFMLMDRGKCGVDIHMLMYFASVGLIYTCCWTVASVGLIYTCVCSQPAPAPLFYYEKALIKEHG